MKRLFLGFVFFSIAALFGCAEPSNSAPKSVSTRTSEGVVLHGCGAATKVIENTNPFSVRIQIVYQGNNADKTRGVILVDAGEKVELVRKFEEDAYLIYTTQGVLIGYIEGKCVD